MGSPATGRKVSIWWDMESCPFPPNIHSHSIPRLGDVLLCTFRINGHIQQFSAYGNFDRVDERVQHTLASSAITLRHVPPGRKETVEKTMLVDMLCWSMDESPPAILIFIVGDIDLSNAIHRLSQRTYGVFLVCYSAHQMAESIFAGVTEWVEWRVLLQQLISVDFNSSRNIHFTNLASFNPTGVILDTDNNYFPTFRSWPYVSTLDDRMSCITTNTFLHRPNCEYEVPYPPCQMPQEIYGQSESVHHLSRINQSSIKDVDIPVRSNRNYRALDLEKASMDNLKSWLIQFLKKQGRKGYPISLIYGEFRKATGKILDLKHLGFPTLVKVLEEFKDVALLKSVSPTEIFMFPIQTGFQREWKPEDIDYDSDAKSKEKSHKDINRKNEGPTIGCTRQSTEISSSEIITPEGRVLIKAKSISRVAIRKNGTIEYKRHSLETSRGEAITPEGRVLIKATSNSRVATRKNGAIEYKRQSAEISSGEVITHEERILIKATLNSKVVTKKNVDKTKASMQDLKMWLSSEVVNGSFSHGIEISSIYDKFKAGTGKVIDLTHLGHNKLSKLLENFKDIITLNKNANSVKLFPTVNDRYLTGNKGESSVMQGERTTTYLTGTKRTSPVMEGERILSKDRTKKAWRAVKPSSDVTGRCIGSYRVPCYSQDMDNKRTPASVLITEKYSRGNSEKLTAVAQNSSDSDSKAVSTVERNTVAVDAGLDMLAVCSMRSMSAGVGERIVTPTISSHSAQQNQPFENEKMKKRHSHKIPREGRMLSFLRHFIMYVYECLTQKRPRRNG